MLRGILAVAVQQHHRVKTVLDGVVIAELLVAAVALVDRAVENGDLAVRVAFAVVGHAVEGVVGGLIVNDQHFDGVVVIVPDGF